MDSLKELKSGIYLVADYKEVSLESAQYSLLPYQEETPLYFTATKIERANNAYEWSQARKAGCVKCLVGFLKSLQRC